MREIEFRGKETFDNEGNRPTGGSRWLYGSLITHDGGITSIAGSREGSREGMRVGFNYDVISETVGQYTGLYDKNGNKIFEGDILKIFHFIDGRRKKHFLYHVVQWSEKYTGWIAANNGQKDADPKNGSPQLWCYVKNEFEIAGNIHDNPELLEANNS